ncbi:hypothetical protein, partial [Pseudomonas syringae group genomosp. 3]|uniref:hypothetical protein n=2 Tax=Pseudomonas syringae group genomosp. 3 TaxID=251701 RepID=UPI001E29506C
GPGLADKDGFLEDKINRLKQKVNTQIQILYSNAFNEAQADEIIDFFWRHSGHSKERGRGKNKGPPQVDNPEPS